MNKFMKIAIEEAENGMEKGDGGPFGAVIVKGDEVIAKGHNRVLVSDDPTAHAEIVAIRKATARMHRFDLSDCELYTTCEPCPMCMGAIHWAKIKKVYYGCTSKDAEQIGFGDKHIYELLAKRTHGVEAIHIDKEKCLAVFKQWKEKADKKMY